MSLIQVSQCYYGDTAPDSSSPAELGATWYDTVAGVLKTLTSKTPYTWTAVSGEGGEAENIVRITADVSNSSTAFADVTGLSFSVAADKDYLVEFFLIVQTDNALSGIGLGVTGPVAFIALCLFGHVVASQTSAAHFSIRAYDEGYIAAGSDGLNNLPAELEGIFRNGANAGTFQLRFRSENDGDAVIVKAGSILRWRLLN